MAEPSESLRLLQQEVAGCRLCPRLIRQCRQVAALKRRAYRDWDYWGAPVPSFGDPQAQLLIIGLAPAAHGANRTGRMFTGDSSGDFLYRALHQTGFASQAASVSRNDGLLLRNAYVTAAVRCAPPANRPLPEEIRACRRHLARELELLPNLRVVVALGKIAFDAYLALLRQRGLPPARPALRFGHCVEHPAGAGQPVLISSYHPSRQNTQTGRLTQAMLRAVFLKARLRLTA